MSEPKIDTAEDSDSSSEDTYGPQIYKENKIEVSSNKDNLEVSNDKNINTKEDVKTSNSRDYAEASNSRDNTEASNSTDINKTKRSKKTINKKHFKEEIFLKHLPNVEIYEKSYTHTTPITHIIVTPKTDFIITCSNDGIVKFWKKQEGDIEYVKTFNSHNGCINGITTSYDGTLVATIGNDKMLCIYEVISFSMICKYTLDYIPTAISFLHRSSTNTILKIRQAIGEKDTGYIYIYTQDSNIPQKKYQVHQSTITCIINHPIHGYAISSSIDGYIEYWCTEDSQMNEIFEHPTNYVNFNLKTETDYLQWMIDNKDNERRIIYSQSINNDGTQLCVWCSDNIIRIFNVQNGKLLRSFDERIEMYENIQLLYQKEEFKKDMDKDINWIHPIDFGRKRNTLIEKDKELINSCINGITRKIPYPQAIFDQSGLYIIYPSLIGIKIINIRTKKIIKILGKQEVNIAHFSTIALFQGRPSKTDIAAETALYIDTMIVPINTEKEDSCLRSFQDDPCIFAAVQGGIFFCIFSMRQPKDIAERDIGTYKEEQATKKESKKNSEIQPMKETNKILSIVGRKPKITIHSIVGDIVQEQLPEIAPKAVYNFIELSKKNYYNGTIFHRVIDGFMIQGGDPRGNGTGGESIWRKPFDDEVNNSVLFDKPGILAMANAGPCTNGSQFFITTAPAKHLNGKHSIFGRVQAGMDIVNTIEKKATDPRNDRPIQDIVILSVTVEQK